MIFSWILWGFVVCNSDRLTNAATRFLPRCSRSSSSVVQSTERIPDGRCFYFERRRDEIPYLSSGAATPRDLADSSPDIPVCVLLPHRDQKFYINNKNPSTPEPTTFMIMTPYISKSS